MLRSWDFHLPTQIQFGRGLLRKLGEFAAPLGSSALLVGYRDRAGLEEAYERAVQSLVKAGVRAATFFDVEPEPAASTAIRGAEVAHEAGAELIVGLGGGSVMDAAKAVAALARSGEWGTSATQLFDVSAEPQPVRQALPVVAIPTTSGTGSEVSDIAVLSAPDANSPGAVLKASIFGPALRPSLAVVDPDLMLGSPAALTAACAADALGHAIEASLSRRANPLASLAAARAVALVVENLPRALDEPRQAAPREALALAATLAGVAFTSAGVVVGHAMAQALGGVFGLSHGAAVALAMPVCLRYNADCCHEIYVELACACREPADPPDSLASRWIEHVAQLLHDAGLVRQIPVNGKTAQQREELVARLVQSARHSARVPILLNPRKTDDAALAELFRQTLGAGRDAPPSLDAKG
jgi:alcohol dehydrogenase class IV